LTSSTHHPAAHEAILKAFETAPARLETPLALGLTGNKAGCENLLKAIDAGKAPFSAVSSRTVALNFQAAKVDLDGWLKKRGKAAPSLDQKTQETIAKRLSAFASFKSDAVAGQKIFAKNCATCHQIAGQGAKVGPNLDGIGARGLERLLEDVLDPNRNVDQAFRTTIITTKAGQTIAGLFLREEGNVVILADKDGKDVRIEKGQIDERVISTQSPMPANFIETLSEPELHNLMAYLLDQRPKS
jgi:putative heme-binding domain-containing protein